MSNVTAYELFQRSCPEKCRPLYTLQGWVNTGKEDRANAPWVWVGAGLSKAADYPLTEEIRKAILQKMFHPDEYEELDKLTFEQLADQATAKCGPTRLQTFLHGLFKNCTDTPTDSHFALAGIPWGQVITTNYDQLLENAWDRTGQGRPVVVLDKNFNQNALDLNTRIWKIHGDRNDWEQIIMSKRSYDEFEQRYRPLNSLLELGMQKVPFFFVGCSMQDPRIYSLLRNLEPDKTFGGVYVIHQESYARLTPEQKETLQRYHYNPIVITDFADIPVILRYLQTKVGVIYHQTRETFTIPYKSLLGTYQPLQHFTLVDVHNFLHTMNHDKMVALTQAIRSEGGVGKTRMAIEYAYAYKNEYPGGVHWFHCEDFQTMLTSLEKIMLKLETQLPVIDDENVRWKAGLKILQSHSGRQLWILDNVDDPQVLSYFKMVEQRDIFQLITTRLSSFGRNVDCKYHSLKLPTDEEALAMFYGYAGRDKSRCSEEEQTAAKEIVVWMGRLPLGLELAGKLLAEQKYSFRYYLTELKEAGLQASGLDVSGHLGNQHIASIRATYQMSQKINEDPLLRKLLLHISLMAPNNIEQSLLEQIMGQTIKEQCQRLIQSGWIKVENDHNGLVFYTHRLIQEAIRLNEQNQLPLEEHMQKLYAYVTAKDIHTDLRALTAWRLHAETAYEIPGGSYLGKANLACWIARWYHTNGNYREAEKWSLRYVNDAQQVSDTEYATAKGNLAGVLQEMGRYEEAEKLYREVLEIHEIAYGEKHPYIAISKGNLAGVLKEMGRYEEAEKLYREVLEIHEIAYGEKHPYIAISKGNLAGLLLKLQRYEDAEVFARAAVDIFTATLPPSHPHITNVKHLLAAILLAQEKVVEALPLLPPEYIAQLLEASISDESDESTDD